MIDDQTYQEEDVFVPSPEQIKSEIYIKLKDKLDGRVIGSKYYYIYKSCCDTAIKTELQNLSYYLIEYSSVNHYFLEDVIEEEQYVLENLFTPLTDEEMQELGFIPF